MWQYAVGAAVLGLGYLWNEESKKLRVGDIAKVPVNQVRLLQGTPTFEQFDLAKLAPALNSNLDILVTRRNGQSVEGVVKVPTGHFVQPGQVAVSFAATSVASIQRGQKVLPGGK